MGARWIFYDSYVLKFVFANGVRYRRRVYSAFGGGAVYVVTSSSLHLFYYQTVAIDFTHFYENAITIAVVQDAIYMR
jgi:hypothetical protein